MSKHRKTRKQKVIADYRRQVYILKNTDAQPIVQNKSSAVTSYDTKLYSYSYVFGDIFKTGILTLVIISLQIILFVFLKNRIIVLPKITY